MRKLVFLDRATLAPQIRLRRPRFEHELVEHPHTAPEDVVRRLQGVSIAIVNKVPLSAKCWRRCPTKPGALPTAWPWPTSAATR